MTKTLQQLWNDGKTILERAGIGEADLDARYLLFHAFSLDASHFFLDRGKMLPEDEQTLESIRRYEEMVKKRAERIPLQHILGTQEFMGLEFDVNENVLIPRQDTESLVELVLTECRERDISLLDMCTGSGCIAISLAKLGGYHQVAAADISPKALAVAEKNKEKLGAEVELVKSDLFDRFDSRRFHVIVSNPPYIPTGVIETLEPEVRDHDPVMALDGDEDGLIFYRRLALESKAHLYSQGKIYLEIGCDQGEEVSRIFKEAGYEQVQVFPDATGKDRIVRACWPGQQP